MKYVDGAQHRNIAECNTEHWGWSNAIDYNFFYSTFTLKTHKECIYCRIEILTKRNKNIILLLAQMHSQSVMQSAVSNHIFELIVFYI